MKVFFTADTHFGHGNIIKYCNRPFSTVEEMDEKLIENWNHVVKPEDMVYHLGDFSLGNKYASYYRKRLNGAITLIIGNHERSALKEPGLFANIYDVLETRVMDKNFVLFHYAMRIWNRSHHGSFHLYGHSHGSLPDDPNSLSFDTGVDCCNYFPIEFEEVKHRMSQKTWKPIDHHGDSKKEMPV